MTPPNEHVKARGRIYSNPAIIRCGECGVLERLTDPDCTAGVEAQGRGWRYTSETGWVCCDCHPLPRLNNGELNRPIQRAVSS